MKKRFYLEGLKRNTIFILAVLLFVIFSFIISDIQLKLDLSKGRAYTLSRSSKKIISKLDDIVLIKFFASSNLPPQLSPVKREVYDLLKEYANSSKNITVEMLSPDKDERAKKDVQDFGIPELQFSQLERNKYAVSSGYFGIGITYNGKKEVIPKVTDISNLEYNITSLIYKMSRKQTNKVYSVGIASSNPFNMSSDEFATFKEVVRKQFEYKNIDIKNNKLDDLEKAAVLVVVDDRKTNFSKEDVSKINSYINQGGNVLFFVDGIWVEDDMSTREANHGFFKLLKDYGLDLNKNLVLSTSAELVSFGSKYVQFLSPYPFWVRAFSFSKEEPFFNNTTVLSYPWASSIDLVQKKGIKVSFLVKTSNKSWTRTGKISLDPKAISLPSQDSLKSFIISAVAQKGRSSVVLIPSSRFLMNKFLTRRTSNLNFILNIIDNLASEGLLSGIRSRDVEFYPLPDISDVQKDMFRYGNIFVPTLVLIIFGGFIYVRRKKIS